MTSNEVHDELAKTLMRERDKHPRHPEDIDSYVLADAILASPLLDRIKREAAAEALEDWIQRLQLASENVGNLGLTISLAAVERDRLRGESE